MNNRELYEKYYSSIYRLALLLLKNDADAEDAAQSVFLKLMEKKPQFADREHAKAWLITVTRNHCRDMQRSFWRRKRADVDLDSEEYRLPEQYVSPLDKRSDLLFEIFRTLPKKQREAVYLYYFEDYSVKEIAKLLDRKESTVQSQLFAARKRMKSQLSASKGVVLALCLVLILGFGALSIDAATGGRAVARIEEAVTRLVPSQQKKLADETMRQDSLSMIYAPDLVAINESYAAIANERGLLIYDRKGGAIAAALDLQAMGCNYLNANSIDTRIFLSDGKLYLFNEDREGSESPEFAYIYDLDGLHPGSGGEDAGLLVRTEDSSEIDEICGLWDSAEGSYLDTFDRFYDRDFLNEDGIRYSEYSIGWSDEGGGLFVSCLVMDSDDGYYIYTEGTDGSIDSEHLDMALPEDLQYVEETVNDGSAGSAGDDGTVGANSGNNVAGDADGSGQELLPPFVYSGDDDVMATVCAYYETAGRRGQYYTDPDDPGYVFIPAPIILGTAEDGDDLLVFVNLWDFVYYRNGNTLDLSAAARIPPGCGCVPRRERLAVTR